MKKVIRDSIVSFLYYTGCGWLTRRIWCGSRPTVRVIAFHDIPHDEWFEETLTRLTKDFHILTPHEFAHEVFSPDRPNILITFDDGYDAWVTVALPVLRKLGIQGLFFINSGILTASRDPDQGMAFVHDRLRVGARMLLTGEGVLALVREGHTVGGHTAHHMRLRDRGDREVQHEVETDKQALESAIGVPLTHFAYPFGTHRDFSKETDCIVRASGYTHLYSAEPGFYISAEDVIPRTLIETGQSYKSITRWLSGAYDVFSFLKRSVMRYSA